MLKLPVDDSVFVKSGHKLSKLWPHSARAMRESGLTKLGSEFEPEFPVAYDIANDQNEGCKETMRRPRCGLWR
jgi:hypothetical protein